MLRVAILSAWHVHADGYAHEFSSLPGVKITCVWDEQPQRGQEFARKFGAEFVPDYHDVLKREDVDAVCVTAPTNRHAELMLAAAGAKKHIYTEKVLCLTNEDAQKVKAAVEMAGIKFLISLPHRANPKNLFAKKCIDDGLLGTVTYMRVRVAHNGSSGGWLPPHFYGKEECGGGAMMDLGAHPMYLTRWLMGKPSECMSAFTHVTEGHEVEDNAVSMFKFPNGAIAVAETGFVSAPSPYALEIYGTDGCLLIDDDGVKLHANNMKADVTGWVSPDRLPEALAYPVKQFVEGITEGKPIVFGIEEAVELTEMMVAAYKADAEGKSVRM